MAADRGNINRESDLAQKRVETEQLRDEIAAGFNKLFEASIVSTLFAYSLEDLDKMCIRDRSYMIAIILSIILLIW